MACRKAWLFLKCLMVVGYNIYIYILYRYVYINGVFEIQPMEALFTMNLVQRVLLSQGWHKQTFPTEICHLWLLKEL